ncbi:hypothetical protein CTAM01_14512 [Colletotrichum tamarilloi]|uniref:Uncharacterized protein n=1 Tax=Colletotrichum tamarilloi TaxID=1209934 RepID=A0ABQ9QP27_9PEZI|nr:uncharacterized protein CTAM01_14512 [Colletotrichum tamarilloi]KAK1479765.1 hypothetical protein CTAM01_14512 [Colletotrichum tamarilloi]
MCPSVSLPARPSLFTSSNAASPSHGIRIPRCPPEDSNLFETLSQSLVVQSGPLPAPACGEDHPTT